jgi:PAS domain S-box-containing protein
MLKHAGYEVMVCGDGRAGLDLIQKERPNLVITELIAPNIDGYDLVRAIRFDPQTSATPIVLQTGHYLKAEVRQLAAKIGVHEVVFKPYEPQALLDAIARAMQGDSSPAADGPEFDFEHMLLVSARLYDKVRAAEVSRQHLETALAKYRVLFHAHPEPLWVVDLETRRFVEVNRAAIQNYGFSRDAFLAMTIDDLDARVAVSPSVDIVTKIAKQGGVLIHRKKDGTVFEVLITTHDLTFEGRESRYFMAQDVTEMHLLATAGVRQTLEAEL